MKFEYFGHACFMIDTGNEKLLFDPFIRQNPLAADVSIENIHADYVFISHAHADHLADIELFTKTSSTQVICNFEIMNWLQKKGLSNFAPLNIGGQRQFKFGKVRMTQAIHSSSFSDGTYGGTAAGFLIEFNNKVIYYAGDTALFSDLKLNSEMYAIDWALLPIGGVFTMDAFDACKAAQLLKCNQIIGLHFDTFEAIKINKTNAIQVFNEQQIQLHIPTIQQTIIL
jgi:L-ascorbate metabolism protein UlaG (beta-lactamase superfamily)